MRSHGIFLGILFCAGIGFTALLLKNFSIPTNSFASPVLYLGSVATVFASFICGGRLSFWAEEKLVNIKEALHAKKLAEKGLSPEQCLGLAAALEQNSYNQAVYFLRNELLTLREGKSPNEQQIRRLNIYLKDKSILPASWIMENTDVLKTPKSLAEHVLPPEKCIELAKAIEQQLIENKEEHLPSKIMEKLKNGQSPNKAEILEINKHHYDVPMSTYKNFYNKGKAETTLLAAVGMAGFVAPLAAAYGISSLAFDKKQPKPINDEKAKTTQVQEINTENSHPAFKDQQWVEKLRPNGEIKTGFVEKTESNIGR